MSRVITFSRTFPAYHPKAGQPTYFVEGIWKSLGHVEIEPFVLLKEIAWGFRMVGGIKHHTIRAGNRWKVGDRFSPRVWSGKPYNSKMITIAPDIEIKKIWDFEINPHFISGYALGRNIVNDNMLKEIAMNDGLDLDDLKSWFNKEFFKGQIICWNESVEY